MPAVSDARANPCPTSAQTEPAKFVAKLYNLLLDEEGQNLAAFTTDGKAFSIPDMTAFANVVLPKHFGKTNYLPSFGREIKAHGFCFNHQTVSKEVAEPYTFSHPLFQRDAPQLLANIKRTSAINTTKLRSVSYPASHCSSSSGQSRRESTNFCRNGAGCSPQACHGLRAASTETGQDADGESVSNCSANISTRALQNNQESPCGFESEGSRYSPSIRSRSSEHSFNISGDRHAIASPASIFVQDSARNSPRGVRNTDQGPQCSTGVQTENAETLSPSHQLCMRRQQEMHQAYGEMLNVLNESLYHQDSIADVLQQMYAAMHQMSGGAILLNFPSSLRPANHDGSLSTIHEHTEGTSAFAPSNSSPGSMIVATPVFRSQSRMSNGLSPIIATTGSRLQNPSQRPSEATDIMPVIRVSPTEALKIAGIEGQGSIVATGRTATPHPAMKSEKGQQNLPSIPEYPLADATLTSQPFSTTKMLDSAQQQSRQHGTSNLVYYTPRIVSQMLH